MPGGSYSLRLMVRSTKSLYDICMTRTVLRSLAWIALIAIAAATLSPIGLRPRLPVSVDLERGVAFLLVGLLFALAYPRRIWLAIAVVIIGAFGLEWLQALRPDRHGRIDDALIKAFGAVIGLTAGWLCIKFVETASRLASRA